MSFCEGGAAEGVRLQGLGGLTPCVAEASDFSVLRSTPGDKTLSLFSPSVSNS